MWSSWSWSVQGSSDTVRALRFRLNLLAQQLGFTQKRGPQPGQGGGGILMREIAEGRAVVLLGDLEWRAWLAQELLQLAQTHPERRAGCERAIRCLMIADDFATRLLEVGQ